MENREYYESNESGTEIKSDIAVLRRALKNTEKVDELIGKVKFGLASRRSAASLIIEIKAMITERINVLNEDA